MTGIAVKHVRNRPDSRGDAYYISHEAMDFIGHVQEIHFVTVVPGAIRGNHYHMGRREVIFMTFSDRWQLAWARAGTSDVSTQNFKGEGAVSIEIGPDLVHAIKNTGSSLIYLVSFSNQRYDPENPDTFRQEILA